MIISGVIGLKEIDKNIKINTRVAVRAVIYRDNKLLMIKTNKGDLKLPGGGIEKDENYKMALCREVSEETGYSVSNIVQSLGSILERCIDDQDKDCIFEMTSNYYLCTVNDKRGNQNLDEYEEEQNFIPVWVSIEEAIINNENVINENNVDMSDWVHREVHVLRILEKYFNSEKGV